MDLAKMTFVLIFFLFGSVFVHGEILPTCTNIPSSLTLLENKTINSDIFNFNCMSLNTGPNAMTVECNNLNFSKESCSYFKIVPSVQNKTYWLGTLRLDKTLELSKSQSFQIRLDAIDSSLKRSSNIIIINIKSTKPLPPIIKTPKNIQRFKRKTVNDPEIGKLKVEVQDPIVRNYKIRYESLNDSNSNKPKFDKNFYEGSVYENASPGTFVNNIFLNVTESMANSSFEIVSDNYFDIFEIKPNKGVRSLEARITIKTNQYFNFNTGQRIYDFTITARETQSTEKKSSSANVRVKLIQINKHPPVFTKNIYMVNVSENIGPNQVIFQVQAFDEDVGNFGNKSILYKITRNPFFSINAKTGEISTKNCRYPGKEPCLDYEISTFRTIPLTVTAKDMDGEGKVGTSKVIVTVLNENDNAPKFSSDLYTATVDDGHIGPITTLPGPINATDLDGNQITYSLEPTNNENNIWTIDPNSGVISSLSPPTFSIAPSNGMFPLVVKASDGEKETTANVNITIKPVNSHAPVFKLPSYKAKISLSSDPGSYVMDCSASDKDDPKTPGGQLRYFIITGSKGDFVINEKTGEVVVSSNPNLEVNLYNITIEVRDLGEPEKKATTVLTVEVFKKGSLVTLDPFEKTINDNILTGEIGKLNANVNSVGQSFTFFFSLSEKKAFDINNNILPNNENIFAIDPNDGTLKLTKSLKNEDIVRWTAKSHLTITNQSNGDQASSTVVIHISSTNKNAPVFPYPWSITNPYYTLEVVEGSDFGNFTVTYNANSPNQVFYSLNDPNNFFTLESPNSGKIKQIRAINSPTKYNMTLVATDNGKPPLSSTAIITVISISQNRPPKFTKKIYKTTISEHISNGAYVIDVKAEDPDNNTLVYSINPEDKRFSINSEGKITVSQKNFNAKNEPMILLNVDVKDQPNNPSQTFTDQTSVQITVVDMNTPPKFSSKNYYTEIDSNSQPNLTFITVTATDNDLNENGRITYSIEKGDKNLFMIDPITGEIKKISNKPLTLDKYNLTIMAKDHGSPPLNDIVDVLITVKPICINNCVPEWEEPSSSFFYSISEDAQIGTKITNLLATPKSSFSNITYQLNNNNQQLPFDIRNENSKHVLYLSKNLNYDLKNHYNFKVVANDSALKSSSEQIFDISVIPIFLYNPRFSYNAKTFCTNPIYLDVGSNLPKGSVVAQINASSSHNQPLQYSINPNSEYFSIDDNGLLKIKNPLKPNTSNSFTIKAEYKNKTLIKNQEKELCQDGSDQSSVKVTIRIPTVFMTDEISFCVKKNTELGSTLGNLNDYLNSVYQPITNYKESNFEYINLKSNGDVVLMKNDDGINGKSFKVPDHNLELRTFSVDPAAKLILITINESVSTFEEKGKSVLLRSLKKMTSNGLQCIVDIGTHSKLNGAFDTSRTDVYLYAINGNTQEAIAPMALNKQYSWIKDRKNASIIGITGAARRWAGFNWEPVAIAIGLIMGLLLLGLLLFCCFCLWPFLAKFCFGKEEEEPFIEANGTWGVKNTVLEEKGDFPQLFNYDDNEHFSSDFKSKKEEGMIDGAGSTISAADLPLERIEATVSRDLPGFGARQGDFNTVTENTKTTTHSSNMREEIEEDMPDNTYPNVIPSENFARETTSYENNGFDNNEPQDEGLITLNKPKNGEKAEIGAVLQGAEHPYKTSKIQTMIGETNDSELPNDNFFNNQSVVIDNGGVDYGNLDQRYYVDPSRMNMAMQNEITLNDLAQYPSYYEGTMGGTMGGTIPFNQPNYGNTGNFVSRSSYREQTEETKFV